ncbi:hypothetical protein [Microbacterium sp. Root180]|uniref:hypothetical protein n=1 Tax=Microbacterium sp. Root180 TaxID=1736483 RepID=UPI0006F9A927|nr:hypothetical protein [Microbacterium sp. Root180]KRB37062.1 hypothetical protein ASD93_13750 [Microbacterium sp. Root180]
MIPILNLDYGRDLVMIAVIFSGAAFVWAGWAQERPPRGALWRIVLVLLQLIALAILAFGIPIAVQHWETPTALASASNALVWYIVVFWLEVIAIVGFSIYFVRTGRGALIAPLVLTVVGLHFVPLAFVFAQWILLIAAVLLTAAGVGAVFLPQRTAAPSFWSGILAAPILLALAAVCLSAGVGALA